MSYTLKSGIYVGIDFETTGLDPAIDEPIQIGLVQFDYEFNILLTYKSYICPSKPLQQLSPIVQDLTGITIDKLENAPTMHQVLEDIGGILQQEHIYLIGHNVSFDYKFLSKYISNPTIKLIDTYQLAQSLIHYISSYALDTLTGLESVQTIYNQMWPDTDAQFHDALYDTKKAIALFRYEYQRIIKLIEEYPILNQILLKTDHMWHKVLNIHHHDIVTQQTTLHLPLMLKPIKTQYNTIKNPPLLLTSTSKYNINTIDLQQVLMSCAVSPCVIAFSHRSKLDQAKAILHTHGIYNIGYTKPDQIILPQHLDQLVNQEEFEEYEVDFIIKYCSLLQQGYSLIPSTNQNDQMILHYLAGTPKLSSQPIILCTHQGLYHIIESEQYLDYHIVMMDYDRRYTTYNQYRSIRFDPQYFLNQISIVAYKTKFVAPDISILHKFETYCTMWVGLFQMAAAQYHKNHTNLSELGPLNQTHEFESSFSSYQSCKLQYKLIRSYLDDYDHRMIEKYFDRIDELYTNVIKLIPQQYQNQTQYLIDQAVNYTDYAEFQEFLKIRQPTIFSLVYTQDCDIPITQSGVAISPKPKVGCTSTNNIEDIATLIGTHNNLIILSNNKFKSKNLFDQLLEAGFTSQMKFLVENVTGGVGKNLSQLDRHKKICLIGGQEFMYTAFAKGFHADHIIAYHIPGPLKQLIMKDIDRYNN